LEKSRGGESFVRGASLLPQSGRTTDKIFNSFNKNRILVQEWQLLWVGPTFFILRSLFNDVRILAVFSAASILGKPDREVPKVKKSLTFAVQVGSNEPANLLPFLLPGD
jgi:hypothetical protein